MTEKPKYSPEFEHFLLWEAGSRDTIDFKKTYVDLARGDILAGLMLSEIVYWYLPSHSGETKLRVFKDGNYWIACPRADWWDRCRLEKRQVDLAIKILRDDCNLIHKAVYMFAGKTTLHVRLDEEVFTLQWNHLIHDPVKNPYKEILLTNHESVIPIGESESRIRDSRITESVIPLQRVRTETTSKEKKMSRISKKSATAPKLPKFNQQIETTSEAEVNNDREIVTILSRLLKNKVLSDSMKDKLEAKVIGASQTGLPVHFPSPADLFDEDTLFQQFVAYAVEDEKKYAKFGVTPSKAVKRIVGYQALNGWIAYENKYRSGHASEEKATAFTEEDDL